MGAADEIFSPKEQVVLLTNTPTQNDKVAVMTHSSFPKLELSLKTPYHMSLSSP